MSCCRSRLGPSLATVQAMRALQRSVSETRASTVEAAASTPRVPAIALAYAEDPEGLLVHAQVGGLLTWEDPRDPGRRFELFTAMRSAKCLEGIARRVYDRVQTLGGPALDREFGVSRMSPRRSLTLGDVAKIMGV